MYGEKRYHDEMYEDIPFLLSQPRVLSPTEFKYKLPNSHYSEYFSIFLSRKLESFLLSHEPDQWFKERYFSPSDKPHVYEIPRKVLLISGISSNSSHQEIRDNFKSIEGVKNVHTALSFDINMGFSYVAYIVPESEEDLEKLFSVLSDHQKCCVVELEKHKSIVETPCSISNLTAILKNLCKYQRKTLDEVLGECKVNNIISEGNLESLAKHEILKILEEYFLFCPVCCKQYDSKIDMLYRCSNHTINCAIQRNTEVLAYSFDITQLKFQGEFDFRRFYRKTATGNFKCKICEKEFEGIEYLVKHLGNKHSEETSDIFKRVEALNTFLSNLDVFALEIVLGLVEKSTPPYAVYSVDKNAVVYDMPQVFSGKLDFK